jgi:D-3-phosphoglycerate dehydrogenase
MPTENELPHKVVLIDYDEALFAPMGFEAEKLAKAGASWETYQLRDKDRVVDVAGDAEVIAIQSVRHLLTREVIAQLPHCRCMIRAGAGYDSIDYKAATEYGIMVCNAPTYCTDDVADHAVALMLASVRHVPRLNARMKEGEYARELARPTRRVVGTTLGIIGLGRIGSTVSRRVHGWNMNVLAYDPYVDQDYADECGATLVDDLDTLLEEAHFITIHCPHTDETYHLLSEGEFARMREGVIIVNAARGPIIDEEALVDALREGRVWAAGLDVTEQEPLPPDSPLLEMDNVILTPHIAANSEAAREDLYRLVCEISADVVQGRTPEWVVNPDVLDHVRPPRR